MGFAVTGATMRAPSVRIFAIAVATCLGSVLVPGRASAADDDVVIKVAAGTDADGIMAALKRARTIRASLGPRARRAIRIVFASGEYPVLEPVVLTAADSGTASSPTILEAEEPGKAVWVGALRIDSPTVQANSPFWRWRVPKAQPLPAEELGGQFFVNDARAVLARTPDLGAPDWLVAGVDAAGSKRAFRADAAVSRTLDAVEQSEGDRAMLHVMQAWTSSRHRMDDVAAGDGVIRVRPAANWPFLAMGDKQRFVLENARAALNAHGEWLQEGRVVSYVPRPGEQPKSSSAYLPVADTLLRIKGDPDDWVEHVQIRGLKFAYTHRALFASGDADWQAAVDVGAAIEVTGTRATQFVDCVFEHMGGNGIWLRRAVQQVVVKRTLFRDMGAGAIKISQPDERDSVKWPTRDNQVLDDVITDTGLDFPGAVAVWVGPSSGNLIQGNVISNTSYSAIAVGWWGEPRATGLASNQVLDNVLWNIGQSKLADLGGVYTLGHWPVTIRGNFIRRVRAYVGYGAGAWGIYDDEGTADATVAGNAVIDAQAGGYHLHFGRDLTVSGNFFVLGGGAEVNWTDVAKSGDWRLEDNVLIGDADVSVRVLGNADRMRSRGNVVGAPDRAEAKRRSCAVGCRASSELSVRSMGADVAGIELDGLSSDQSKVWAALKQKAQTLVDAARTRYGDQSGLPRAGTALTGLLQRFAPDERFEAVTLDFTKMAPGVPKTPLEFVSGGRPDLIEIAELDPFHPGTRCLRLKDGEPGLRGFEPLVVLNRAAGQGVVTADFKIWVDDLTSLLHEWRDGGSPYRVGPSLMIDASGVRSGGQLLTALTPNRWYRFQVSSPIGKTGARWTLSVWADDGRLLVRASRPAASSDWKKLAWMGWASMTEQPARTCFATMAVRNE